MESVGDARSFLPAARQVAMRKPIIVIKAGRTAEASKAASSHTWALTESYGPPSNFSRLRKNSLRFNQGLKLWREMQASASIFSCGPAAVFAAVVFAR